MAGGNEVLLTPEEGEHFLPWMRCVWECLLGDLSRSCVCIASAVLSLRLCACWEEPGRRGLMEMTGLPQSFGLVVRRPQVKPGPAIPPDWGLQGTRGSL